MKGDLKSLQLLWLNLAKNHRYSSFIEEEDLLTFSNRLEHEGLHFLTTTLPGLGRALDEFHSTTEWTAPPDFKVDGDSIPIFMGKAVRFALDGNSKAVDCVRQLAYIFYKLEVDYDDSTVAKYLEKFTNTDRALGCSTHPESLSTYGIVEHMKGLIRRVLCNADPMDIRPCHGSGATACRTENSDKWHLLRYYPKLDAVYSYADYFFYNYTHLLDEMDLLEESKESVPQARVVLVPKDSRGPRIISCEPAELMYIQQGLMRLLYKTIENHRLTSGMINFANQEINRNLAHQGSLDGAWATIDLSDASDRVSLDLVRRVFPENWVRSLEACRSESTILPDGSVVELNKFAPMGSACCFPVEALVFWTCAMAAIREQVPHSRVPVYVYGDDIIVPSQFAEVVMRGLESIGLVVNSKKSYWKGPFRESCGGDYHSGYEVTPVRVRKFLSNVGTGIAASADLANSLIAKFGYDSVRECISVIESAIGYVFPRSELLLPATVHVPPSASNDAFYRRRWNHDLQRYEHRILSYSTRALARRPPSWSELLRKELTREYKSDTNGEYLPDHRVVERSLEPGMYADVHSARRKWTWTWLG